MWHGSFTAVLSRVALWVSLPTTLDKTALNKAAYCPHWICVKAEASQWRRDGASRALVNRPAGIGRDRRRGLVLLAPAGGPRPATAPGAQRAGQGYDGAAPRCADVS